MLYFTKRGFTPLFFVLVGLTACSQPSLPEYWLCKGKSTQTLLSVDQQVLESYRGQKPLLLERFNGVIAQYMSGAFTGIYQECMNNEQELAFRVGSCEVDKRDGEARPTNGMLNKLTGKLQLSETQIRPQGSLVNEGAYQCEFLGNAYSPSVFYKAE